MVGLPSDPQEPEMSILLEVQKMVYRGRVKDGVVVLDDPNSLPEGTEVRVEAVESSQQTTQAEPFADESERRLILLRVTARMRANRWPENIARFSRSELHERR